MKKMGALWGTFLVLCVTAASATDGACKNPQFYMGAGTHMGQNKLDLARANIFFKYTRINSFRDEFYWSRLETEPGVLKIPANLADLDKAVSHHSVSKGPRPLIPLTYGNKFYDKGDLPRSDEAIQAYSRYAGFVAATYAASAPIFEIWNEWNGGMGSRIVPRQKGSADDYVKLMQGAVPLIKKASPQSLILAGATAHIDLNWSLRFVELGGLESVDGFSIHPYNYRHHSHRSAEDIVQGLKLLQEKMSKAASLPSVPFYLTEIGLPSSTGKNGHTEEVMATYAARFLLLVRTQPYICGVWWYELLDSGSRDEEDEHRFGLFRQDGAAKPAAKVIAQIADFLKDGQDFAEKRNGSIQSVKWGMPDGSRYLAYWSVKGQESLALDTSQYTEVKLHFDNDATEVTAQETASTVINLGPRPRIFKQLKQ